jgi:hypothetical protein
VIQIRVTKKFANDLKLKDLPEPQHVISIFDDWVIDVVTLSRKKVAMATHLASRLTFFFPYSSVGGAKNVAGFIGVAIQDFLSNNDLEKYTNEIESIFDSVFYCANTADKSLIANVTNMKQILSAYTGENFEMINWHRMNKSVNDIIMRSKSSNNEYFSPKERMMSLLKL